MTIRGKKVLVTGGSRGIGYEIARRLVTEGCEVIVTGRNEDTLKKAAETIGAKWMVWDIADISILKEKFGEVIKTLGGLDTVVSNAGVLTREDHEWGMGMLELTEDEWDNVININLKANFFLMQTTVKYFYENGIKGNLLNIGSVASIEPSCGPYGVSKVGVAGLTKGWGKQFAPFGIVINSIGPGPIATEMNHWHEGDSLAHSRIPTGRFGTVEEVGELAMYLLSKEAVQVIGQTFIIDGAYDI
ncbi:MAG: SDR family oxidoreductase [Clostridia bacterium]|nr:SDR family oxidoreductase [Clostridia bacterium]